MGLAVSGESWPAELFDRLYAERADPWRFETSPYEQDKYAETLARLGQGRFERALELGCSIGVFSKLLAGRCGQLLALDAAAAAVAAARTRCVGLAHVEFRRATLPQEWPEGSFDLIVVSELLYFLSPDDIALLARRSAAAAAEGCTVLLVNWTGETDTPTTGDEAARLFIAAATGFSADPPLRRPSYRLDRLYRTPGKP